MSKKVDPLTSALLKVGFEGLDREAMTIQDLVDFRSLGEHLPTLEEELKFTAAVTEIIEDLKANPAELARWAKRAGKLDSRRLKSIEADELPEDEIESSGDESGDIVLEDEDQPKRKARKKK